MAHQRLTFFLSQRVGQNTLGVKRDIYVNEWLDRENVALHAELKSLGVIVGLNALVVEVVDYLVAEIYKELEMPIVLGEGGG
jgi:hypothetical protein